MIRLLFIPRELAGNSLAGSTKTTRFVFVQIRLPFMKNSIFANHARSQATHRVERTQNWLRRKTWTHTVRNIHHSEETNDSETLRNVKRLNPCVPQKLPNQLASSWLFLVKLIFSQNLYATPCIAQFLHVSSMVHKTTISWVNRCLKGTLSA